MQTTVLQPLSGRCEARLARASGAMRVRVSAGLIANAEELTQAATNGSGPRRRRRPPAIAVLAACLGVFAMTAAVRAAPLIGDYRFAPEAPLANSVANGLPDLLFNEFHAEFPPLLTGQEIPAGGVGAAGNGWALAWTTHVPQVGYDKYVPSDCRIPADPRLALRDGFTLWMRIIYGGQARGDRGYNLVLLHGADGDPVLAWTISPAEELALELRLADAAGTISQHRLETAGNRVLPRFSRWYDLAVSFDGAVVTMAATELTRAGPGPTRTQSFPLGRGLTPAPVTGPLQILHSTNTALERFRVYSGAALAVPDLEALSAGVRVPGPTPPAPVEAGLARQLFLDDAVIAGMTALERVVHPVRKYEGNPVIGKQTPIDGIGPNFWGSVLYDRQERCFKLWCQPLTFQQPEICNHLYFTSADGVNWTRPKLDILGPDNRFWPPSYPAGHAGMWLTVRKDPAAADPAARYRGFIQRGPYYAVRSADGLHWEIEGIAAHHTDDTTTAMYHPLWRKYVKIGRFCPDGRSLALRLMMVCRSATVLAGDNSAWHLVMFPNAQDLAADPATQFYHMPAFAYHELGIGILGIYHSGPEDGRSDHELTVSRDGLNWQRVCQGQKFIERGAPGAWDGGFGVLPGTPPFRVGDELWFYYGCNSGTHHSLGEGAIGLAKLRLDGFASLRAGAQRGRLLTRPFVWVGTGLEVNAAVRGTLQVRVLNAASGTELAVGLPYRGDSCHAQLCWRDRENLAFLRGRRVQLEFSLNDADLFAFQVHE